MNKDNTLYLEDILNAITKIEGYLDSISYISFLEDEMRQDAVIRQLEIIGEAVRNFLIHGYDEVDVQVVWKTIESDLPLLKQKITHIIG